MNKVVAVIGGGPAGMMAASVSARGGNKTILIEKNKTLGKKLLITGKGRCNVTNNAPIEDFIKNVPVNGNFLYSAFYSFTNDDLVSLLAKLGVETKVERGERIFPVSDKAADILNALKKMMSNYGVRVYNGEVADIKITDNGKKRIVLSDKKALECDSVVIATGGVSYPLTGSTGDGYKFAKKLGHTVTDIKPSLVPIELNESCVREMMGLSLKNVAVTVYNGTKKVYEDFGEMLFTHFGASGPVILSASSHMKNPAQNDYKLVIDLKPALDFQTLDKRILRDFEQLKNKDFANSLNSLLPKKLIPVIIQLSGIDPHAKVNEITREQRHKLVDLLKNLTFTVKKFRPVSEAIVTSGGVNVKEINPSTMESKITPGVFFAGEVIDVDAYTGGFNLQIAFSTGFVAGMNV
ncbi:MAG: NAD(P)/FAD-dependent oxidoreductase [Clostridia bacterium]|nr:NAD(P)/FAD-dependent oxidoreductase [Clostridia bacterium]